MVKGIQKQVVLVNPPDQKLFEQAIFILKEGAEVTDEALLREARKAIHGIEPRNQARSALSRPFWALLGAGVTGLVWLLTLLF